MLLEIGLTVGLALAAPASGAGPEPEALRLCAPRLSSGSPAEFSIKPEGAKWAPNRMKILLFQSKGRWVVRERPLPVEKYFCLPIERTEL